MLVFERKGKDRSLLAILPEDRTDRIMRYRFGPIDHGRLDKLAVDAAAVAVFRKVAFGVFEPFEKSSFEILAENLSRQLQGARGILHDLDTFDPGDLLEVPPATR